MTNQPINHDRNFDDLAGRFQKNIYGGLKGDIRLAVLERDFNECLPNALLNVTQTQAPLRILDAGGGQGQFSLRFAKAGHHLVICDISAEMLKLAEIEVNSAGLQNNVTLVHCAIQDLMGFLAKEDHQFDVVLCHAVMEWVVRPSDLLAALIGYVKPQGYLSLTFYNLHSLIYKNLLRTNFKKIKQKNFIGSKGSLTPISPLYPEQVFQWLHELPMSILAVSGIRVFHDYIFDQQQRERDVQSLIELELEFSRREPYKLLGRYVHLLCCKVKV